MDNRENLIELLDIIIQPGEKTLGDIADHLISHGVTVQEQIRDHYWATEQAYKNGKADALKWIPVTERLPEKNTSVLGYYHGRNIFWYDEKDGFCDIDQYGMTYPIDSVTYWMPLPEPPEGA